MAKKIRLTCDVTKDVIELIIMCGRMIELRRGAKTKAVRVLMQMAYDTPDTKVHFFEGKEKETVSVEVPIDDISKLETYMRLHAELNERRRGFKSALLKGLTVYMNTRDKQALVDQYKQQFGFKNKDEDDDED